MKISADGIDLIKAFEGCRLTAYKCPAGVWTIGYGSTGQTVKQGMTITQAQADALLQSDLVRFENGVKQCVTARLKQSQFDALVSFAFNLGIGALRGSTLLKLLNAGKYAEAADQFPRWNKAGGKVLSGLVRRRAAERMLFLGDSEWRFIL